MLCFLKRQVNHTLILNLNGYFVVRYLMRRFSESKTFSLSWLATNLSFDCIVFRSDVLAVVGRVELVHWLVYEVKRLKHIAWCQNQAIFCYFSSFFSDEGSFVRCSQNPHQRKCPKNWIKIPKKEEQLTITKTFMEVIWCRIYKKNNLNLRPQQQSLIWSFMITCNTGSPCSSSPLELKHTFLF